MLKYLQETLLFLQMAQKVILFEVLSFLTTRVQPQLAEICRWKLGVLYKQPH